MKQRLDHSTYTREEQDTADTKLWSILVHHSFMKIAIDLSGGVLTSMEEKDDEYVFVSWQNGSKLFTYHERQCETSIRAVAL